MSDVDYSEMYLVPKEIYNKIMNSIKPEDGEIFFSHNNSLDVNRKRRWGGQPAGGDDSFHPPPSHYPPSPSDSVSNISMHSEEEIPPNQGLGGDQPPMHGEEGRKEGDGGAHHQGEDIFKHPGQLPRKRKYPDTPPSTKLPSSKSKTRGPKTSQNPGYPFKLPTEDVPPTTSRDGYQSKEESYPSFNTDYAKEKVERPQYHSTPTQQSPSSPPPPPPPPSYPSSSNDPSHINPGPSHKASSISSEKSDKKKRGKSSYPSFDPVNARDKVERPKVGKKEGTKQTESEKGAGSTDLPKGPPTKGMGPGYAWSQYNPNYNQGSRKKVLIPPTTFGHIRGAKKRATEENKSTEISKLIDQILSTRDSNHYKVMNISPDSELREVKERFKKVSKVLHPDKNKDPRAHEAYIKFHHSYTEIEKDLKFLAQYNVQRKKMFDTQNRPFQYGMGVCKWLSL